MIRHDSITQLMNYVHGPTLDLRIKTPDARIPRPQIGSQVIAAEHNSSPK